MPLITRHGSLVGLKETDLNSFWKSEELYWNLYRMRLTWMFGESVCSKKRQKYLQYDGGKEEARGWCEDTNKIHPRQLFSIEYGFSVHIPKFLLVIFLLNTILEGWLCTKTQPEQIASQFHPFINLLCLFVYFSHAIIFSAASCFPFCCPFVLHSLSQVRPCQLMAERWALPGWWALLAW